jgi:acetyltransferase-like isoleucine patch superfamily enzyme
MFILRLLRESWERIVKRIEYIRTYIVLKRNRVEIGKGSIQNINGVPFIINCGTCVIGDRVTLNSKYSANAIGGQTFLSIVVKENAKLVIDDDSGISNSAIYCAQDIYIGKKVSIGGDCKIYDTDFHSIHLSERNTNVKTSPVIIKDGVFIGTGAIILKGVTIGTESVIGAGSVVTKNIPDYEVWAGNPAKFIKKLEKSLG